jgi:dolichol kinase
VRAALHDPLVVLATFAYIALLLLLLRAISRFRPLAGSTLRRWTHTGVGVGTLVATPLFLSRGWALVAPAAFVALNLAGAPERALPALRREGRDPALWMFPLSVVVLYLLFWNDLNRAPVLAGIAALGLADPAASAAGSRYGERRYAGWGHGRSLEGSAVYLLVTGVATAVIASWVPDPLPALRLAIGCGAVGALTEAITPTGWDNLSAPVAVAVAFRFLA